MHDDIDVTTQAFRNASYLVIERVNPVIGAAEKVKCTYIDHNHVGIHITQDGLYWFYPWACVYRVEIVPPVQ